MNIWENYKKETAQLCGSWPALVRKTKPLVHLLTNYVTVNDCVNAVLAVGGRAICSHSRREAAEVCSGADALVCNLGGTEYYAAMDLAAQEAGRLGIPLVIDPVGCSASAYRREKCRRMIEEFHPAAIRGNYAEIAALIEDCSEGGGLDSTVDIDGDELEIFAEQMRLFAKKNSLVLIASGAADLCTDGREVRKVERGTPALKKITGAGCLSTAVLAAFLAACRAGKPAESAEAAEPLSSGSSGKGLKSLTFAAQPNAIWTLSAAAGGAQKEAEFLADAGFAQREPEFVTDAGFAQKESAVFALDAVQAALNYVALSGEAAEKACRQTGTGVGHFHMYFLDALCGGDAILM